MLDTCHTMLVDQGVRQGICVVGDGEVRRVPPPSETALAGHYVMDQGRVCKKMMICHVLLQSDFLNLKYRPASQRYKRHDV